MVKATHLSVSLAWSILGKKAQSVAVQAVLKALQEGFAEHDVRAPSSRRRVHGATPAGPPSEPVRRICHVIDMQFLRSEEFFRWRNLWATRGPIAEMELEQTLVVNAIWTICLNYAKKWHQKTKNKNGNWQETKYYRHMRKCLGPGPEYNYPELPERAEYDNIPRGMLATSETPAKRKRPNVDSKKPAKRRQPAQVSTAPISGTAVPTPVLGHVRQPAHVLATAISGTTVPRPALGHVRQPAQVSTAPISGTTVPRPALGHVRQPTHVLAAPVAMHDTTVLEPSILTPGRVNEINQVLDRMNTYNRAIMSRIHQSGTVNQHQRNLLQLAYGLVGHISSEITAILFIQNVSWLDRATIDYLVTNLWPLLRDFASPQNIESVDATGSGYDRLLSNLRSIIRFELTRVTMDCREGAGFGRDSASGAVRNRLNNLFGAHIPLIGRDVRLRLDEEGLRLRFPARFLIPQSAPAPVQATYSEGQTMLPMGRVIVSNPTTPRQLTLAPPPASVDRIPRPSRTVSENSKPAPPTLILDRQISIRVASIPKPRGRYRPIMDIPMPDASIIRWNDVNLAGITFDDLEVAVAATLPGRHTRPSTITCLYYGLFMNETKFKTEAEKKPRLKMVPRHEAMMISDSDQLNVWRRMTSGLYTDSGVKKGIPVLLVVCRWEGVAADFGI